MPLMIHAFRASFKRLIKRRRQMQVRMYFTVPKDVTPKTLAMKEGESRTYEFEVK